MVRSWYLSLGLGVCVCLGTHGGYAAVITPTDAFASTFYGAQQSPTNLINDAGLNTASGDVLTYTHASHGSAVGMWHAGAGQGTGGAAPVVANQYLVFDLGANYDLSKAYLWQMLQPGNLGRGIKEFSLYGSSDAPYTTIPPAVYDLTGYTELLSGAELAQGSGTSTPTQDFNLLGATNIRTVYLQVNSAWSGNANDYVGLSEIKFEGTPLVPPTPTVTPTLAYASTYYAAAQSPTNLINNSGLNTSSDNVDLFVHFPHGSANNMWHAGAGQGTTGAAPVVADQYLMFDLGGNYDLTEAFLWQLAQNGNLGRGIKEFRLLGSPDAAKAEEILNPSDTPDLAGFTEILSTTTLAQWSGSGNATTQAFDLTAASNIRRVYLEVISSHSGNINDYVGLAEIKFGGAQISPESVTWTETTGGAWQTGDNWSNGVVPTPNTSVTIDAAGSYAISMNSDQTIADFTLAAEGATLNIDGARLITNSLQVNQGALEVHNGAIVQSLGDIVTAQGGGLSKITVDGTGSWLVTTRGNLTIEGNGVNDLALQVANGGKVDAYGSIIINNATAQLSGGSTLSTLTNGQLLVGTSNGVGSLVISGGSVANVGTTYIGNALNSTGSIVVDGAGSKLLAPAGALIIGWGTTGSLTITDGGLVENWTSDTEVGDFRLGNNGHGTLTVGKSDGTDAGGSTLRTRLLHLRAINGSPGIVNINPGGTVELRDGLVIAAHTGSVVNLQGGTLKTPYLLIPESADDLVFTSGTLWLTGPSGFTSNVGGVITVPTAGFFKGNGNLGGGVKVLGTISPGDEHSIATLSVKDLTIGESAGAQGTYEVDIDLTSSTSDLLEVAGTVDLAHAMLNVSLHNLPTDLTSPLTLLLINNDDSDGVTGTFADVVLNLPSQFAYSIDYEFAGAALNGTGDGNDVAITLTATAAVPEPATMLLLLAGFGLFALRARPTMAS